MSASEGSIPPLSRRQVREVDRLSIEEYGLPGIVLMENAARAVADAAAELAGQSRRVLIVCGGGNNGGDGYAAARHLASRGFEVTLLAAAPLESLQGDAATNAQVAARMELPIRPARPEEIEAFTNGVVVDALLGTGLSSPPRPDAAALIAAMNRSAADVVAVDLPSGLDCDTGRALGEEAVRAAVTVTFVAPKAGFAKAENHTGRVIVADIGCPRGAIDRALAESE